jgi:hypothetical protein
MGPREVARVQRDEGSGDDGVMDDTTVLVYRSRETEALCPAAEICERARRKIAVTSFKGKRLLLGIRSAAKAEAPQLCQKRLVRANRIADMGMADLEHLLRR